jgi:hypothetical protein
MPALYNCFGACLVIRSEDWVELRRLACEHGWRPAGTSKPAISLDIDRTQSCNENWNGNYDDPCGQIVTRNDARALSEALGELLLRGPSERLATPLLQVRSLAESGGFIIARADDFATIAEAATTSTWDYIQAEVAPASSY